MTLAATAAGTWLREAAAVPARAADGADAMPSSFRYAQHDVGKRLSAIDAVAIVNVIVSRTAALLVERGAIPGRRALERRGTGAVAGAVLPSLSRACAAARSCDRQARR